MQSIAAENNVANTAFFVPADGGYEIRWFTPTSEVDLCGHATMASAFTVFERLQPGTQRVTFQSKSGPLRVARKNGMLALDFPSRPPEVCEDASALAAALGKQPEEALRAKALLAVFATESEVRALAPDMNALANLDAYGVIVTAPGGDVDFVSRFFAPKVGVPEDSVTGSAHTTLIPYWARRLGKNVLRARQVSKRGGELWCELIADRVSIAGTASLYLEGTIDV